MRQSQYEIEIEALLAEKVFIGIEDIISVCPGIPMPTIYSKVRKLVGEGKLSVMGKGKYVSAPKVKYSVVITSWMRKVNDYLIANCPGVEFCVAEKDGNMFVQVPKTEIQKTLQALNNKYDKLLLQDAFNRFPGKLNGYIVLCRLISESPMVDYEGVNVSPFEKSVVDEISDGNLSVGQFELQKAVETYPINLDRLVRYAARRGIKEQVSEMVSGLDYSRLSLISKVQKYLSTIPVERAWVFGSFARGEETAESDLDILVDYQNGSGLSLLDVVRFKSELEKRTGREVDLIQNGYLKPFAVPSVERDKYMIYER